MSAPRNTNRIRGMVWRVRDHIFSKPKSCPEKDHVDAAAVGTKRYILPGEALIFFFQGFSSGQSSWCYMHLMKGQRLNRPKGAVDQGSEKL